jgi:thiamine-phosphate diphosphorylase/hydroxyethylthiazole kinase
LPGKRNNKLTKPKVVQNFAANIALAVGASPIMANYAEEAADLAKLGGALVINMGTVTPEGLKNHLQALKAYNAAGRPVVLDPVGAGATSVRRAAAKSILSAGYLDVVKGNEGEIRTIYALTDDEPMNGTPAEQQRGVDSSSTLSIQQKSDIVTDLARRLKNIVVLTGKIDFVSNGDVTVAIDNGHALLGEVTGTGCVLGTTISAMVAAYPDDKLAAVVAGILQFNLAAEGAATRESVKGPGSFVPAFIDELVRIREQSAAGDYRWLQGAKAYRTGR